MQHLAEPSATWAEKQAYRLGVPGFPGPIDRWLISNSRMPRISHLSDYLMLEDPNSEYVTCFVERSCDSVSKFPSQFLKVAAEPSRD